MPATRIKPIGLGGSNKKQNWNTSLKDDLIQEVRSLNTKFINIEGIVFDATNPRQLHLTISDIKNGPKLYNPESFTASDHDKFKNDVLEHFSKPELAEEYLELSNLALSIKSPSNLINPITVELKDRQFHLIAGHRRTFAHIILGEKEIAANIITKQTEPLEKALIQWRENQDRADLCLYDQLMNIKKLDDSWLNKTSKKLISNDLIQLTQLKKSQSKAYLSVLNEITMNPRFGLIIKNKKLSNLDAAYLVPNLKAKIKTEVISVLEKGPPLSKQQLKHLIQSLSNKHSVVKKEKSAAIKINNNKERDLFKKLLSIAISSNEFKHIIGEYKIDDLSNNNTLNEIWKKLLNSNKL